MTARCCSGYGFKIALSGQKCRFDVVLSHCTVIGQKVLVFLTSKQKKFELRLSNISFLISRLKTKALSVFIVTITQVSCTIEYCVVWVLGTKVDHAYACLLLCLPFKTTYVTETYKRSTNIYLAVCSWCKAQCRSWRLACTVHGAWQCAVHGAW